MQNTRKVNDIFFIYQKIHCFFFTTTLHSRQCNSHGRIFVNLTCYTDIAVHLLHNSVNNWKAEPGSGTFHFRGKKRRKQLLNVLLHDPNAIVCHFKMQVVAFTGGPDLNLFLKCTVCRFAEFFIDSIP